MREVYGQEEAVELGDPTWIADMTDCGLVLFSKDAQIRKTHACDVLACGAQAFLLPEQGISAKEQIARYTRVRFKVAMRARRAGPYVYMVRPADLDHFPLECND